MTKMFTKGEVAAHNTEKDCWIIIRDKVYDVTSFIADHPGGKKVVVREAGKDSTAKFEALHDADNVIRKYAKDLYIGDLAPSSKL